MPALVYGTYRALPTLDTATPRALKRIRAAEAKAKLGTLVANVVDPVIIEHTGQPAAVLISYADYYYSLR